MSTLKRQVRGIHETMATNFYFIMPTLLFFSPKNSVVTPPFKKSWQNTLFQYQEFSNLATQAPIFCPV